MADSGIWAGGEGLVGFFKHMGNRYSMPGARMVHMRLTPVIEVSADNRSAKGMWNSFGSNTIRGEGGKLEVNFQAREAPASSDLQSSSGRGVCDEG